MSERTDSSLIQINGSCYLNITSNNDFEINEKENLDNEKGNWFSELSSENCFLNCQKNITLIINYKTEIIQKGKTSNGFELENKKVINGWNELDFERIGFIID